MLKIDAEFRDLIPNHSADELVELEASIVREGCRDPIITWNGIILDGHNRYSICEKNAVKFMVRDFDSEEIPDRTAAKIWIIRNQLGRRNLKEAQRAVLVCMRDSLVKEISEAAKGRQLATFPPTGGKDQTANVLATMAGVGSRTIERVMSAISSPVAELKTALLDGQISARAAESISKLPEQEQRDVLRNYDTLSKQLEQKRTLVLNYEWPASHILDVLIRKLGKSVVSAIYEKLSEMKLRGEL